MTAEEPERKFFMPSEVARLVLGYLKATNCENSWKTFLAESKHLSEYYDCYKNGCEYPTTIGGKTLVDILNNKGGVVKVRETESSTALLNVEQKLDDLSKLVQQTRNCNKEVINENVFKTPSKELRTPKRIRLQEGVVSKSQETQSPGLRVTPRKSLTPKRRDFSQIEESDCSGSEGIQSEHIKEAIRIKPGVIVEELMNRPELHEKLAEKINSIFGVDPNATLTENNTKSFSDTNTEIPVDTITSCDFNIDLLPIDGSITENEIHLPDSAIQDIFNLFQAEPEVNDFVRSCAAKQDIFSEFSSPLSASSPTSSSLTTPQHIQRFRSPISTPRRLFSDAVKNLIDDLKTPEKNGSSSSPIPETPINADPSSTDVSSPVKSSTITPDIITVVNSPANTIVQTDTTQVQQLICLPTSYGQYFSQPTFVIANPSLTRLSTSGTQPKEVVPMIKLKQLRKKQPLGKRVNSTPLINLQQQKKAQNSESLGRRILPKGSIQVSASNDSRSNIENSKNVTRLTKNPKRLVNKVSRSLNFVSYDPSTPTMEKTQENKGSVSEKNKTNDETEMTNSSKKTKREDEVLLLNMNVDDFLSKIHGNRK